MCINLMSASTNLNQRMEHGESNETGNKQFFEKNNLDELYHHHLLLSSRYALLLLELHDYFNEFWNIYQENKNESYAPEIKFQFFESLPDTALVLRDMQKSLKFSHFSSITDSSSSFNIKAKPNDVEKSISSYLRLIESKFNQSDDCIKSELDFARESIITFLNTHYKLVPPNVTQEKCEYTKKLITDIFEGCQTPQDKIEEIDCLISLQIRNIKNTMKSYGFNFQD